MFVPGTTSTVEREAAYRGHRRVGGCVVGPIEFDAGDFEVAIEAAVGVSEIVEEVEANLSGVDRAGKHVLEPLELVGVDGDPHVEVGDGSVADLELDSLGAGLSGRMDDDGRGIADWGRSGGGRRSRAAAGCGQEGAFAGGPEGREDRRGSSAVAAQRAAGPLPTVVVAEHDRRDASVKRGLHVGGDFGGAGWVARAVRRAVWPWGLDAFVAHLGGKHRFVGILLHPSEVAFRASGVDAVAGLGRQEVDPTFVGELQMARLQTCGVVGHGLICASGFKAGRHVAPDVHIFPVAEVIATEYPGVDGWVVGELASHLLAQAVGIPMFEWAPSTAVAAASAEVVDVEHAPDRDESNFEAASLGHVEDRTNVGGMTVVELELSFAERCGRVTRAGTEGKHSAAGVVEQRQPYAGIASVLQMIEIGGGFALVGPEGEIPGGVVDRNGGLRLGRILIGGESHGSEHRRDKGQKYEQAKPAKSSSHRLSSIDLRAISNAKVGESPVLLFRRERAGVGNHVWH